MRKRTKVILIVAAAVIVLVAAALIAFFVLKAEDGKKISGIYVSTYPQNTQYYVGDNADFDDISVIVTHKNGDFYYVGAEDCEFTGFDSSEPVDSQTITVKYLEYTCTFTVRIAPLPELVKTLTSIELIKSPKTEYIVGEWLDTSGGVLQLNYNDGSFFYVSLLNRYVYGFTSDEPNEELVLTIRYTENGVLCETTYTVTVAEG